MSDYLVKIFDTVASKTKQFWFGFIDFLHKKLKIKRKKITISILIILCIFIGILDIMWLITPPAPPKTKIEEPLYKKEDIPRLITYYQETLRKDNNNYQAHLELGKIFVFIDELENAKVEFFQAIELAPPQNYDARFYLTQTYIALKTPEMAQEILNGIPLNSVNEKTALKKLEMMDTIARLYSNQRKYKEAHEILKVLCLEYEKYNLIKNRDEAQELLTASLMNIVDEAYYKQKNPVKAFMYLDESLKIFENPWAYTKLGFLFFEDPILSSKYFDKAFSFGGAVTNYEVLESIFTESLKISEGKKDTPMIEYYKGLLERIRAENLSAKVNTSIIITKMDGFLEQTANNCYIPAVAIEICNKKQKKALHYLKVRTVFFDMNNKIIGHNDSLVLESNEILPKGRKKYLDIRSNRPIPESFRKNNLCKAIFYISKEEPDRWTFTGSKIFR